MLTYKAAAFQRKPDIISDLADANGNLASIRIPAQVEDPIYVGLPRSRPRPRQRLQLVRTPKGPVQYALTNH